MKEGERRRFHCNDSSSNGDCKKLSIHLRRPRYIARLSVRIHSELSVEDAVAFLSMTWHGSEVVFSLPCHRHDIAPVKILF